jgi:hypothetical protein
MERSGRWPLSQRCSGCADRSRHGGLRRRRGRNTKRSVHAHPRPAPEEPGSASGIGPTAAPAEARTRYQTRRKKCARQRQNATVRGPPCLEFYIGLAEVPAVRPNPKP